jgi:peptidoglycan/xylan/chitin deacetylase (PgdA/CDA1 family)
MKINLRNVVSFVIANIYINLGVIKRRLQKISNEHIITSIYFHKPSKKMFESCLFWLKRHGYNFISVNDILEISNGQKAFPENAVLVTIDDGWITNKDNVVEVGNALKVPITLFITTNPMETGEAFWWSSIKEANRLGLISISVAYLKTLTNKQRVKQLEEIKSKISLNREAITPNELIEIAKSKYISIGSHTVNHPILKMCNDEESFFEIKESKNKLEHILGSKVESFAYPNGDFSLREINYLKNTGYKIAFTTVPNYITAANIYDNYSLPRFEILEHCSLAENICRMTGIWFDIKLFKHNK